jgi:hypothetical protein
MLKTFTSSFVLIANQNQNKMTDSQPAGHPTIRPSSRHPDGGLILETTGKQGAGYYIGVVVRVHTIFFDFTIT